MTTLSPGVAASQAGGPQAISVTLNTASDVNILTEATSAGWDNAAGGTLNITVASGQTLTASSTAGYALRTGALHADTVLSIIVEGTVQGATGATGSTGVEAANGTAGSPGGDAVYLEHLTGGSGSVSLTVAVGGTVGGGSGGGGGGGGPGRRQTFVDLGKGGTVCQAPSYLGSAGAAGSAGATGQAQSGSAGAGGTFGGGSATCPMTLVGAGGAGGAAGKAVEDNAKSYSLTDNGTIYGATT